MLCGTASDCTGNQMVVKFVSWGTLQGSCRRHRQDYYPEFYACCKAAFFERIRICSLSIDKARPICLDGRRALMIDEKYPGRDKRFVTCVIDGCSGEIIWLKEGKGAASPDGFFRSLTPEQKEDIEVVSMDRGNAPYFFTGKRIRMMPKGKNGISCCK